MSNSLKKLWQSLGVSALLIFVTVVLHEVLAASRPIHLISPFTLLSLVFASYAFISFIGMVHEEHLSQAWRAASLQVIIAALLAISLGTGSGWVAGIGLSIIGVALVLPLEFLKKEDRNESDVS